jgi:hypothetical protein
MSCWEVMTDYDTWMKRRLELATGFSETQKDFDYSQVTYHQSFLEQALTASCYSIGYYLSCISGFVQLDLLVLLVFTVLEMTLEGSILKIPEFISQFVASMGQSS